MPAVRLKFSGILYGWKSFKRFGELPAYGG